MPFPNVAMPSVWNIPAAIGVPALLGQSIVGGVEASVSVFAGTALSNLQIDAIAAQWGVFDSSGNQIFQGASVRALGYESQHHISDAPQENGAFVSYNKVKIPFITTIELICDGSRGYPQDAFLFDLQSLEKNTTIYSVRTPEIIYPSVNLIAHRYRREARRGIEMIVAEIVLQEVRVAPSAGYTSTSQPQGQPNVTTGNVQGQAPASSQAATVSAAWAARGYT